MSTTLEIKTEITFKELVNSLPKNVTVSLATSFNQVRAVRVGTTPIYIPKALRATEKDLDTKAIGACTVKEGDNGYYMSLPETVVKATAW